MEPEPGRKPARIAVSLRAGSRAWAFERRVSDSTAAVVITVVLIAPLVILAGAAWVAVLIAGAV